MKSRRDFFRQFVGNMGFLFDEFHGVECVSLSRLNELPDNIVKKIEPVFFPEEKWEIRDQVLYISTVKSAKIKVLDLNSVDILAIECFKKSMTLERTTFEIKKNSELPSYDIYKLVTLLFFNLANLHICHPKKVYSIDEIVKSDKSKSSEQY